MSVIKKPRPRVEVGEVIQAIERVLDRYWRQELKDFVETPVDLDSPHVFCFLQELDRFRCQLQESHSKPDPQR